MSSPTVDLPRRFNLASYFVDGNVEQGRGQRVAIVHDDDEITYNDVQDRVNRMGNGLIRLGIEIENRVLLILRDCPEFVYAFFGAIKIGAVAVPVNTLLTSEDYYYILEDSRAKVLVVDTALLPTITSVLPRLHYLKHLMLVGEDQAAVDADGLPLPTVRLDDLLQAESPLLESADTTRDDVAFWLYTSGTTGSPSAAVHLHHDMVHCVELYAKPILGISESDRTFSVAKLFFAYGLGNSLYFPFSVGATTILYSGRPTPSAVFGIVNRYRPTIFFGVPTSYAGMIQAMEQGEQVDMTSVRIATSAGEPLSAHLYRAWLECTGVHILDGIGTTEVLHIFVSNRQDDIRPGSTGKPVPGYEVSLVDDEDNPVGSEEIGNLMVRGDSICSCYWNKHDVTRRAIQGEWIRTLDKYHMDRDGYFWYDGRSDDMLKVGGVWVSPAEVEQAVAEHPAVLECAVVGVRDSESLIKPKAFVVLKERVDDEACLAREIQMSVKERLAVYKYPREIEFIGELPKTATGKIQRYKLREPR